MDFLSMFEEKMLQKIASDKEYQRITNEIKEQRSIYCDLVNQAEFRVLVKPAYHDGFEKIGESEWAFSQKVFDSAKKFVEAWPPKKIKLLKKAEKTHFKRRKEKLLSYIKDNDRHYSYYFDAFERRKKYQEYLVDHDPYDFKWAENLLKMKERVFACKALAELSSTPEMADFVEKRILARGNSFVVSGYNLKYDSLASEIINEKIKKIEKEEKNEGIKPIKDKILQSYKPVINVREDISEQQL